MIVTNFRNGETVSIVHLGAFGRRMSGDVIHAGRTFSFYGDQIILITNTLEENIYILKKYDTFMHFRTLDSYCNEQLWGFLFTTTTSHVLLRRDRSFNSSIC